MKCPTCKTSDLKPTKLAEGLPAFMCPVCHGHLIEVLSYRLWAERHASAEQQTVTHDYTDVADSKQALVCPQCHKLMTKFMMSDKTTNKIDLCGHCGRFWIDVGEWALVKALNLATNLTKIFNEPWQKAIRHARVVSTYEDKLKQLLSEEDYSQLKNVQRWINEHPLKGDILDYLSRLR